MTDKPTPTTDLLKRCAEIHEWRSTGVLSGEALRDYAKRKWPDRHDTLQMAEHETVTEALALLAKWGSPQPVVREPLSGREAFEAAWEKLHGKRPVLWSHMFAEHKMETPPHSEGNYFARDEQAAWKLWQARAALAAQGGK